MANTITDLTSKIDEIFGFNLYNSIDGVNYNFGQYKLNQMYKPLVKYFILKFSEYLEERENKSDKDQIVTLFLDFFKLYFWQGDFGYFKSKYSSFTYKVPYSIDYTGKDTEFRWATKDCYYVKTSDVVNAMDVEIPSEDLVGRQIRLQFFKKAKANEDGSYDVDVTMEKHEDEETEELLGYNITIYNRDETGAKAANKKIILEKIQELGIQGGPGLEKMLTEFLTKRGRDFFIHKRLKNFLTGELERYLFQVLKGDTQGRIDVLEVQKQIEEIKAKYADDQSVVDFKIGQIYASMEHKAQPTIYQSACVWITNFINILADLEEFKAKLWNKKRKVIKQEYCITIGKFLEYESLVPRKNEILKEILHNNKQIKEREDLLSAGHKHLDKITISGIKSELESGMINMATNMVVDTKRFSKSSKLYQTVHERGQKKLYEDGAKLDGLLIKSENYQGLNNLIDDYKGQIQGTYIDPPFNLGENGDFMYKTDYLDGSWCSLLNDRYMLTKILMNDSSSIFTRCDYNGTSLVRFLKNNLFGVDSFLNEILLGKSAKITERLKKYHSDHDMLFFYSLRNDYKFQQVTKKREDIKWQPMHLPGIRWSPIPEEYVKLFSKENIKIDGGRQKTIARIIFGKEYLPPSGRHRALSQDTIFDREKDGTIRINEKGNPESLQSSEQLLTDNWTDVVGYSRTTGFSTENSETILYRCIKSITDKNDIFLDYFVGSATTQAVAQKLGRKWIGVELGNQFEQYDIPRLKSVIMGEQKGISKEKDVDYKGGGSFTYLYLNQYEDRFSPNGYLSVLEGDITKLTTMNDVNQISHILVPLQELKNRIYAIDDTLSDEQLVQMSSMITEK